MKVIVPHVPEDRVVEAACREPRGVEIVDPAQVLVLHCHIRRNLVQRGVLFASPCDGGIDALGDRVTERPDIVQHLIVHAGQSCGFIAARCRDVPRHTRNRGLEPGLIVVAELGEHRAAAGRRVRQHALHLELARLAGELVRTGVEKLECGRAQRGVCPDRLDESEGLIRRTPGTEERPGATRLPGISLKATSLTMPSVPSLPMNKSTASPPGAKP